MPSRRSVDFHNGKTLFLMKYNRIYFSSGIDPDGSVFNITITTSLIKTSVGELTWARVLARRTQ